MPAARLSIVGVVPSLAATADAESWRERANCRGGPVSVFYPNGETGEAARDIAAAKQLCERCAVRAECLSDAMDHPETDGIWGGLTERERRRLRRRRAREASGAASGGVPGAAPSGQLG